MASSFIRHKAVISAFATIGFVASALEVSSAAEHNAAIGLRVPVSFELGTNGEFSRPKISTVNHADFYQAMPPGLYSNVWGIFIGIANYKTYNRLLNATRDAEDLSRAFAENCGLANPIVLLDQAATHDAVEEAFREIGRRDGPGDLFVFHFSGHGIGLTNQDTGQLGGLMVLHDAPPPEQLPGARGFLDMTLLRSMAEAAGIDAKHQLYLLDCCYSGMGATLQSRGALGASVRNMLAQRAHYVITAGGAGHPVLDGDTSDGGGHGLLSGFLLQAIWDPKKFQIPLEEFQDQQLVSTRRLYLAAHDSIQTQADAIWSAELRRLDQNQRRQRAVPSLPRRDGGTSPIAELRRNDDLFKIVQNPQEFSYGTEGWVYLPLRGPSRNTAAATVNGPSPEHHLGAAGRMADLSWCDTIGATYKSYEYSAQLRHLFQILNVGIPPSTAKTDPIEVEAELSRRPRIVGRALEAIVSIGQIRAKYPETKNDPARAARLQRIELERCRNRITGIQWQPLQLRGDAASVHYELRVQLVNRGREPVYCYVFQLDQSGVLQWLAPRNNSWRDDELDQRISFGRNPLPPGEAIGLPEDLVAEGVRLPTGWPVEDDDVDMEFCAIFTRAPWKELETALSEAASGAWEISEGPKRVRRRNLNFGLSDVCPPLRAVGRVDHSFGTAGNSGSSATLAPIRQRTQGDLLILTWNVDVRSADQFYPEIIPNR